MEHTFFYKARDRKGVLIRGEIQAQSALAARKQIAQLDLIPIQISSYALFRNFEKFLQAILIALKRPTLQEILTFTQELQTAYSVGMPISDALTLIQKQIKNDYFKKIIIQVNRQVRDGKSLSDAFSAAPPVLSPVYINLLRAGENSGEFDTILKRLCKVLEQQIELRSKLKSAAFYPMIAVIGVIMSFISTVTVVIPKIKIFLAKFNTELPLITRIVVGISDFVLGYTVWILIAMVIIASLIFKELNQERGRKLLDQTLLKIPQVGHVLLLAELNSFCFLTQVLLQSGINLVDSIRIASRSLSNSVIRNELNRSDKLIEQGAKISSSLSKSTLFPPLFINLISMAEETGSLEPALEKISSHYTKEMNYRLTNLSKLLEPLLLAFIFIFVIILASAVFLPIWKMSQSLQRR
jgi:type II secretory pathway component PulF